MQEGGEQEVEGKLIGGKREGMVKSCLKLLGHTLHSHIASCES